MGTSTVAKRFEIKQGRRMDTFIVRIYRRDKEEIAGIVEMVGEGEKMKFSDIEGLLGILGFNASGNQEKDGKT